MNDASDRLSGTARVAIPFYVIAVVGVQAVLASGRILLGVVTCALLIVALVNHHAFAGAGTARVPFLALTLVPLTTLVVLAVPIDDLSDQAQQVLVVAPLVPALVLTTRAVRRRRGTGRRAIDVAIALSGVPLGYAAYAIARPEGVSAAASAADLLFTSVVVCLPAVVEEIVFRGIVQSAFAAVYVRSAPLWSAVLFAASYLPVRPLGYVALMACVGLLYGAAVQATHSLLGVMLGHVALNVGLFVVWPWYLS